MATPGVLHVRSRILPQPNAQFTATSTNPAFTLTPDVFLRWYQEEHIADVLATGGVASASQWQSINANEEFPWLVLYELDDLAFLGSEKFKAIPTQSQRFLPKDEDGWGGEIAGWVEFEAAILSEKKSGGEDRGEEKWMVEAIGEETVEVGGNMRVLERQGEEHGKGRYAILLQMDEEPTSEKLKMLEGQGKVRVYKLLGQFPTSSA